MKNKNEDNDLNSFSLNIKLWLFQTLKIKHSNEEFI